MANVRKINTRPQFGSPIFRTGHGSVSGFRVAAYARVSTDLEEQNSSFEAQKDYYERLISETPEEQIAFNTAKVNTLRVVNQSCQGEIFGGAFLVHTDSD